MKSIFAGRVNNLTLHLKQLEKEENYFEDIQILKVKNDDEWYRMMIKNSKGNKTEWGNVNKDYIPLYRPA